MMLTDALRCWILDPFLKLKSLTQVRLRDLKYRMVNFPQNRQPQI